MLINLRNALMTGKKSPLPLGARWVGYLESTGTQWIDTGLIWDSLKWECFAKITATKRILENYSISQYGSGQGVVYAFVYISTNDVRLAYNANTAAGQLVPADFFGTEYEWHAVYENGNQTLNIGDNIALASNQQWAPGRTQTAMRIIIGGMQTYGGKSDGVRFGRVKILHDSVLVRDFNPIAIGTTSYMLDLVSGEYLQYGNAGTGNFVIGPDIPSPV